jgi:hypothetical protein
VTLDKAVEALYVAANFAFTELDADGEAAAVLTVALVDYEAIKAHDVPATPTVVPLKRESA